MFFTDIPDIVKVDIQQYEELLLKEILFDRTTRKNIIWATNNYVNFGSEYEFHSGIFPKQITGEYERLIQPRIAKTMETKDGRTKDKAEVFTPSWVCNKQNNIIDIQWFGYSGVFNKEIENSWIVNTSKVFFPGEGIHTWKKYVDAKRLEVSCGEAPYLVSRYDTVTGEKIPVEKRIGLLDRKLRIVSENAKTEKEWLKWAERAFQSVYGYEYQGDSLLLARENLLITYIDYFYEKFSRAPEKSLLLRIAKIISWNLWQMDGMKYVVPGSCKSIQYEDITLFGIKSIEEPCPGCEYDKIYEHTGTYCKIYDWRSKKSLLFISMMKGDNYE